MTINDTSTVLAQLRTVLDLTNTEIQVADTRVSQARTDAVRRELSQNAANGRARAEAVKTAIRELGGFPDVILLGPPPAPWWRAEWSLCPNGLVALVPGYSSISGRWRLVAFLALVR